MLSFKCPLCGNEEKCRDLKDDCNGFIKYRCDTYKVKYSLADEIAYTTYDDNTNEKLLNLVVEQLLHSPSCKINGVDDTWHFFYEPNYHMAETDSPNYINLADRINNYPTTTMDLVDRVLLNLSYAYPNYGEYINPSIKEKRIAFETGNDTGLLFGIFRITNDLGYTKPYREHSHAFIISADGWKRIDELRKNEMILKQAFIAMQFGEKTIFIREAFRKAIRECGYSERFIDEKEHNNQIVPEILYEISRSKFMVVDISFPNYGAYYEAGYGQALGKEVIICCSKEKFENSETRPHFDIAQKSMIIWKDTDDLIARLKKRIEATVK